MDLALKTKWTKALRSGQYKQGRNYLRRDGKYCCLGVLCEVMGENDYGEGSLPGFPRDETLERAGLTWEAANGLAALNDTWNSFAVIADVIEGEQ